MKKRDIYSWPPEKEWNWGLALTRFRLRQDRAGQEHKVSHLAKCPGSLHLTCISEALLPRSLSNFKAIDSSALPTLRLRDITNSYDDAACGMLKRAPDSTRTSVGPHLLGTRAEDVAALGVCGRITSANTNPGRYRPISTSSRHVDDVHVSVHTAGIFKLWFAFHFVI